MCWKSATPPRARRTRTARTVERCHAGKYFVARFCPRRRIAFSATSLRIRGAIPATDIALALANHAGTRPTRAHALVRQLPPLAGLEDSRAAERVWLLAHGDDLRRAWRRGPDPVWLVRWAIAAGADRDAVVRAVASCVLNVLHLASDLPRRCEAAVCEVHARAIAPGENVQGWFAECEALASDARTRALLRDSIDPEEAIELQARLPSCHNALAAAHHCIRLADERSYADAAPLAVAHAVWTWRDAADPTMERPIACLEYCERIRTEVPCPF